MPCSSIWSRKPRRLSTPPETGAAPCGAGGPEKRGRPEGRPLRMKAQLLLGLQGLQRRRPFSACRGCRRRRRACRGCTHRRRLQGLQAPQAFFGLQGLHAPHALPGIACLAGRGGLAGGVGGAGEAAARRADSHAHTDDRRGKQTGPIGFHGSSPDLVFPIMRRTIRKSPTVMLTDMLARKNGLPRSQLRERPLRRRAGKALLTVVKRD